MTWIAPHQWIVDDEITAQLLNETRGNMLAISHPYDYSPALVDINSNATDQTIYTKLISGGDLGVNGSLELALLGDCLKNNGAGDTVNLRVKFGGVTHVAGAISPNFDNAQISSTRFSWHLRLLIANKAAANVQYLRATYNSIDANGITNRHDLNQWSPGDAPWTSSYANPTIDTTADQTLAVSVQWSAASPNNSWRKQVAVLRLAQN